MYSQYDFYYLPLSHNQTIDVLDHLLPTTEQVFDWSQRLVTAALIDNDNSPRNPNIAINFSLISRLREKKRWLVQLEARFGDKQVRVHFRHSPQAHFNIFSLNHSYYTHKMCKLIRIYYGYIYQHDLLLLLLL